MLILNILFVWMFRLCVLLFDLSLWEGFLLGHSAQICVYCHIHAVVSRMDEMRLKYLWDADHSFEMSVRFSQEEESATCWQTNKWTSCSLVLMCPVLSCQSLCLKSEGLSCCCCFALIVLFYIEFCVVLLWFCCFMFYFVVYCLIFYFNCGICFVNTYDLSLSLKTSYIVNK